jgi:uncharacterized protein with von Willebrand factor type A (vWA) domain
MSLVDDIKDKHDIANDEEVERALDEKSREFESSFRADLRARNPFKENEAKLRASKQKFADSSDDFSTLEQDYGSYKELDEITGEHMDHQYWEDEIKNLKELKSNDSNKEKLNSEVKASHRLLLEKWEDELLKSKSTWELNEYEKARKDFMDKIEEWLELIEEMKEVMDDLSIEPGILMSFEDGELSKYDVEELKRFAKLLSKDKGIKELCDILGRLRCIEKSSKEETFKATTFSEKKVVDYSSKEEIVGIELGSDIERILPQELASLGDIELSLLFDKKFVESQLMYFKMQGSKKESYEKEVEEVREVEEEDKLGPVILCIDTSGSMAGMPEQVAKAITLYIATRAMKQKRDCYLINFSVQIQTTDLSGKMGLKKIIEFLSQSFRGGTDVDPALTEAVRKIDSEKYDKADVLVISDFIMNNIPITLQEKIKKVKENNNKFYSLSIGNFNNFSAVDEIFDKKWTYNPKTSSVAEIKNMADDIFS